jgi:Ca2+/H+ antiporter
MEVARSPETLAALRAAVKEEMLVLMDWDMGHFLSV